MILKNIYINCLVATFFLLLFSCNSNSQDNKSTPSVEQPSKEITGKNLFENNCATCHGNDGTAGISGAANLQTSKLPSDSIETTITNGRGNMPTFKTMLTEKEIKQLTEYAKDLRK